MKKVPWISVLAVLIILCFAVSALTDFYVIPVSKNGFAPVAQTGQTVSGRTHDDGNLNKGVPWPSPRFTNNYNGTVTDNLTGLVWLKDADCTGRETWADAIDFCKNLNTGECGLTDGSSAGEWRLPNIKELQSLIDYSQYGSSTVLPSGHPFDDVQGNTYWTSTQSADSTSLAWQVDIYRGDTNDVAKSNIRYVWPVRDGN